MGSALTSEQGQWKQAFGEELQIRTSVFRRLHYNHLSHMTVHKKTLFGQHNILTLRLRSDMTTRNLEFHTQNCTVHRQFNGLKKRFCTVYNSSQQFTAK